jgi:putative transposase
MTNLKYRLFHKRHLPHFQPAGATIFVTTRLAHSLPHFVIERLVAKSEHATAKSLISGDSTERARQSRVEERRSFKRWERALESAKGGPSWLSDQRVAAMVAESVHHRDGKAYDLDAFCILNNHMHIVFTPCLDADGSCRSLSSIMHSLKRHTARQANLLLEREGEFWQHENYDHLVRDDADWRRIITYVLNNPVAAGLVKGWDEWKWAYCKYL